MSTVTEQLSAVNANGMERTESGLIVPSGTVEKKREAWDYNDYKMLHRAQKSMKPHNATVFIVCNECGKQIASEMNPISGAHDLVCGCKVRRIV